MYKDKKAAIELSISTVVIIVLGVTMLILGITLVTKIMGFGTDSVDTLSDKVMGEIAGLFAQEGSSVAVKLGSDKTVKIEAGSDPFGISFGAQLPDGAPLNSRDHLKYRLTLEDTNEPRSCVMKSGGLAAVQGWFDRTAAFNGDVSFGKIDGSTAAGLIKIRVPKATAECSQRVSIGVVDTTAAAPFIGSDIFVFEVQKESLF